MSFQGTNRTDQRCGLQEESSEFAKSWSPGPDAPLGANVMDSRGLRGVLHWLHRG
jgi:hypothetical protein